MRSSYQYVKIRDVYLCIQQNPFILAWMLARRGGKLPSSLGGRTWLRLVQYRLHLKRRNAALELPVAGTFCIRVRGGYKIFDIRRGLSVKIFTDDIETEAIEKEIARLKKLRSHDFCPSIQRWDIQERWYECREDFFSGDSGYSLTPCDSAAFMQIYYESVAACLERLILAEPPKTVNLRAYVRQISDGLDETLTARGNTANDAIDRIKRFVASTVAQLNTLKDAPVYLAFSHGDFHQFNLFRTSDGMKLIDWEGFGQRSVLFDFFNYFFSQLYLDNTSTNLVEEITEAISSLHARLYAGTPDIADSIIESPRTYRWLYYIERIYSFVYTYGLPMDKVLRWVDAFTGFEENRSSDCSKSPQSKYSDSREPISC